jgi:hypothetical protein
MTETIDLEGERERKRIAVAEEAMRTNAMVISGNRLQPKLVWTLRPRTEAELRRLIEAEGMAPFRFLKAQTLPRDAITWPGAPYWAAYAYLVLVEVKALFGNE